MARTVTWMWKGKRHSGTLIRETATHKYARTKNGKVKVLGPGAIHDNFIPEVNKMPELDEHGKKIRAEFSS